MSSPKITPGAWRDETVALAVSEVLDEMPEADAEAVKAAANRCRTEVPVLSGLPLLRHRIRQRVLGIPLMANS